MRSAAARFVPMVLIWAATCVGPVGAQTSAVPAQPAPPSAAASAPGQPVPASSASPPAQPASAPTAATPPAPAASSPAPYVDRIIEGIGDAQADDGPAFDGTGWPRSLRLESRLTRERSSITLPNTVGAVAAYGTLETPNHGIWSLDVDLQRDTLRSDANRLSTTGGLGRRLSQGFAVRQRAFPAGEGLMIDNQAGLLGTPAAALPGLLSRVFVPSQRVLGASSQWHQSRSRWRLGGAAGEPLQFDGLYATRVLRMPGRVMQVGGALEGEPLEEPGLARQVVRPSWQIGAQAIQAQGLAPYGVYAAAWRDAGVPNPNDRYDARSIWVGAGGEHQDVQWQLHGLDSALALNPTSNVGAVATRRTGKGGWFDLAWKAGGLRHIAGAYLLGNGLHWGGLPMASDVQGGYYRSTWQSRQWVVDGGLDALRSTAQTGFDGYYAVGSVRRRIDSTLLWGGSMALREFNGRAYSATSDVQWRHDLGLSDVRVDAVLEPEGRRQTRLTLQHDWSLDGGWSLATSVGAGQQRSSEGTQSIASAASSFDVPLTGRSSLRGTLNHEVVGGQRRSGVNLAAVWPFLSGWTMEAGANHDRGRVSVTRTLDPLAPPEIAPTGALHSTSMYLVLRYELRAGTSSIPLGGRERDGGGTVEGVVFFDANRNGRQDAGERGVGGASVVLDGRYAVKTDTQGRFEFPWVAAGARVVTVLNETLPLPWSVQDEGRTSIDVRLRDTTRVSIGVVQQ